MEIIFATNNQHKIKELQALLPKSIKLISLADSGIEEELPEPFNTFNENAHSKARYVYEKKRINCIAEDSGLSVNALNGAPGVFSARFAGENANDEENNILLMAKMKGIKDRTAFYSSVISLIMNEKEYLFEGTCNGHISEDKRGTDGFGYDPLFIPDGFTQTFAEMGMKEKLTISHRTQSVAKLLAFIETLQQKN